MKLFAFFAFVVTVSAANITLSSSPDCESSIATLTVCGNHTVPIRDPGIISAHIELEDNIRTHEEVIFYSTYCGQPGKRSLVQQSTSCYHIPFEPLCLEIVCGEVSCHIIISYYLFWRDHWYRRQHSTSSAICDMRLSYNIMSKPSCVNWIPPIFICWTVITQRVFHY